MRSSPQHPAAKRALPWLAVLVLCLCMPQLWTVCRSHDGAVQVELRHAGGACGHDDHTEPTAGAFASADGLEVPAVAAAPSCEHSDLLLDTPPPPRAERPSTPRAEPNAWATYWHALIDRAAPSRRDRADGDPPPLPPDRQQRRSLATTRLLV